MKNRLTKRVPSRIYGVMILFLMMVGCDNATSPNQDLSSSYDTPVTMQSGDAVNAEHEGMAIYTVDGFYFLAPMVKDSEYSGMFDGGLSPVVEICETTACDAPLHASFDMNGDGSEQVRVVEEDEHYIVNWNTNSSGAEAGQTYRVQVLVNGITLGHADVAVVNTGREAVSVRSDGLIALVANQTLPVKFRIETGIVGAVVVSPDEATIEVGESQQFTAALFDLHGEPLTGPVVMWSSDDTGVADVDANGLATGQSEGEAVITAASGPATGSAQLIVTKESVGGQRIAFTSTRDGNSEIYVVDADGSNLTRLTNNAALDFEPSISADGQRVAFTSERDGNFEIYVVDADGTNLTRLTNNAAADFQPSMSADGQRVAFTSFRDGNFEIYVVDADGTNLTNLSNNAAFDGGPSISGN